MLRSLLIAVTMCCLSISLPTGLAADAKPASPLLGVWQAESLQFDGNAAPDEAAKKMRFTFKEDKLLIRGNFEDAREDVCDYKVDATTTPKQLDFTPPDKKKPVLGIYEVQGDTLKICLRHQESQAGRPTEFVSKPESQTILIVLKKQPQ